MVTLGDCLTLLRDVPEKSVDLFFSDPPFNIGYEYDKYNDAKPRSEYLREARIWIAHAMRVLKPTGSFWLAIGEEVYTQLDVIATSLGFLPRQLVIWHYEFGVACTSKYQRCTTLLRWYTKSKDFYFEPERVISKRLMLGDTRADPLGKIPSNVWSVPRLPGNANERTGHPCQMPESVLERIVVGHCPPGGLTLDPFSGSGTTAVVCKKTGREFIGFELSPKYHAMSMRRLNATKPKS